MHLRCYLLHVWGNWSKRNKNFPLWCHVLGAAWVCKPILCAATNEARGWKEGTILFCFFFGRGFWCGNKTLVLFCFFFISKLLPAHINSVSSYLTSMIGAEPVWSLSTVGLSTSSCSSITFTTALWYRCWSVGGIVSWVIMGKECSILGIWLTCTPTFSHGFFF